jgi:hypothetical protein
MWHLSLAVTFTRTLGHLTSRQARQVGLETSLGRAWAVCFPPFVPPLSLIYLHSPSTFSDSCDVHGAPQPCVVLVVKVKEGQTVPCIVTF